MARYRYHCTTDGPFERGYSIGTAPPTTHCEICCGTSHRLFTFGGMITTNPAAAKALELHSESQTTPGVVRRSKHSDQTSAPRYADPRHRLLPRP